MENNCKPYIINILFQGDSRCRDTYSAYSKTSIEELENIIESLDVYPDIIDDCVFNYIEEDDNDEIWTSMTIQNAEEFESTNWFKGLECIYDERN